MASTVIKGGTVVTHEVAAQRRREARRGLGPRRGDLRRDPTGGATQLVALPGVLADVAAGVVGRN